MSTENPESFPNYPEAPAAHAGISVHVPLAILALAIVLYFAVQLRNTSKQSEIMRWQLGNLDKQTENLKASQKKFSEAITSSDDTVKQAEQIQGQWINLFNDLLDLSKDDKDVKEVVDKWGIKRNEAAKPSAAEAGAPAKEK
jgi:cell shape-determining protein MreC